ncbi:EamA family transporter [Helicobacter cappadocius]|uniref:EamA family transporter n=1 Tax=Helicobacter cappadocius TaxID=3063998 RepID=A0AA90PRA3_9HELI|nr:MULTISPECIES: EamA family transporter [unclassified Helicobacter]MDO7253543.1 EamA family transporter [Helicobacter sp. faydin-H75]MDP2539471.1 EamA family transporter [Helicobacter sp. faydin-H76]
MIKFIPIILFSVALNAFAQIFIKKGMMSLGSLSVSMDFILRGLGNFYLWMGMLCYAISVLSWMVVLSKVNVSIAYPFLSLGFIFSAIVAYYAFGEPLTLYKIIGIALICAGLFFLTISKG